MESPPWLWVASLLLLSPLSSGQQCPPASRLPVAMSLSCLELEEAATPPQGSQLPVSPVPVVTTSGGLFDWWYTVPNLIVATTQTNPLPKGIVNEATSTLVQQRYIEDADFERFQPRYLSWSTPIILVACTGVLIGLLFLLAGCCLCTCSCLCNLRKEKTYRPRLVTRQTCVRFICWNSLTTISGVFVLFGFLMACSCAVTLNEATYSVPAALHQTGSTTISYLNTTKQEFESQLSSGLEQTANCINGQVNDVPAAVGEAVLSAFDLMDHRQNVTTDCLQVLAFTEMTGSAVQIVAQQHQALVARLDAISLCSSALLENCTALRMEGGCGVLQELSDSLSTISSTQLPDLVGNATVLQNYLQTDLKPSLLQVRDLLANTSAVFASVVNSQIGDTVDPVALDLLKAQSQNISESFADTVNDASRLTTHVLEWLEDLLSAAPSSLTSDAPERSMLVLLLSLYNYGYLIGVSFCVLSGLLLLALAVCLVLGCVAYERIPQTRNRKAQHMKRCVRLLIFFIFIAAFVSMALTSFVYFLGVNVHEICEGLQGPQYSALSETLDDPEWRLSNLQQMLQSTNGQAFFRPILASNISSSSVLSQCFGGATSWQVFDLKDSINTSDLSLGFIREALSSAIAAQQSLLAAAVPAALTALSGPGPATDLADAVNAISRQNTIHQPLDYSLYLGSLQTLLSAARSVQVQMGNLTVMRSDVDASNQTSCGLRNGLADLFKETEDIEFLVEEIERQAVQIMSLSDVFPGAREKLQESLDHLSNSLDDFLADQSNETAISQMFAMEAIVCWLGEVEKYSAAVEDLVRYNTSSCYPLWEAYATTYTATCVNLLGSLNGLWFAMGWCVLGLIPLLVGVVGVQSHFVKTRVPDRRSTSNVQTNLTSNKSVALVSHARRQQTAPPVDVQAGSELDVIHNAWTGEVIPLPQDRTIPDESSDVPPRSGTDLDTRRDYFRQYSWTLSSVDHEVYENENTLISEGPPSYENLV